MYSGGFDSRVSLASQPLQPTAAACRGTHTDTHTRTHTHTHVGYTRQSRTPLSGGRGRLVGPRRGSGYRLGSARESVHFCRTRSALIGRRCGSSFGSECWGWGPFMVVINNGDGNCAGRNAVNLFAQTTHWLWVFMASQRGGELGRRYPPHSAENTQYFTCAPQYAQKYACECSETGQRCVQM